MGNSEITISIPNEVYLLIIENTQKKQKKIDFYNKLKDCLTSSDINIELTETAKSALNIRDASLNILSKIGEFSEISNRDILLKAKFGFNELDIFGSLNVPEEFENFVKKINKFSDFLDFEKKRNFLEKQLNILRSIIDKHKRHALNYDAKPGATFVLSKEWLKYLHLILNKIDELLQNTNFEIVKLHSLEIPNFLQYKKIILDVLKRKIPDNDFWIFDDNIYQQHRNNIQEIIDDSLDLIEAIDETRFSTGYESLENWLNQINITKEVADNFFKKLTKTELLLLYNIFLELVNTIMKPAVSLSDKEIELKIKKSFEDNFIELYDYFQEDLIINNIDQFELSSEIEVLFDNYFSFPYFEKINPSFETPFNSEEHFPDGEDKLKDDSKVSSCEKVGFKYNDEVIRPASVKLIIPPPEDIVSKESPTSDSTENSVKDKDVNQVENNKEKNKNAES